MKRRSGVLVGGPAFPDKTQRNAKGGGMKNGGSSDLRENPAQKCAENHDLRGFSRIFVHFAQMLHVFAQISLIYRAKTCEMLREYVRNVARQRANIAQNTQKSARIREDHGS